MNAAVIVPAAGAGRRMGGVPKAFLPLLGEPMLLHTLRPFIASASVASIVVALEAGEAADPPPWLTRLDGRIRLVVGGSERGESVRAALEVMAPSAGIVLIHDAARPLVTTELIERAVRAASTGESVVVGVPVTDTLQEVDDQNRIVATPDRRRFWRAQTPQAFPRSVVAEAYRRAHENGVHATDDAALVIRYGGAVRVIEGDVANLKVTTPADVVVAEALLRARLAQ